MKLQTVACKTDREKFTITYTYIYNTMGGLLDKEEIEKVKQELREHYDVKTIKEVDHILKIKMEKVEKGIWISQRAYTIQILEKFGMSKYKPRLILLFIEISLSSNDRPEIEEEISIDIIGPLSKSNELDTIVVIVDQ